MVMQVQSTSFGLRSLSSRAPVIGLTCPRTVVVPAPYGGQKPKSDRGDLATTNTGVDSGLDRGMIRSLESWPGITALIVGSWNDARRTDPLIAAFSFCNLPFVAPKPGQKWATTDSNVKWHKSARYPELENVLYEWFLQYQEKVNMIGEMIQTKAKEFLQKMYEQFKERHGIKSYKRFGESDSVVMENINDAFPQIRVKLEIFYWKDIYNMDETDLFYRLQADHSLAIMQLEGKKKDKKRLTVVVCYNRDGSDKVPLWVIEKGEINPEKINVLDAIHFINVSWNIDVKPTTIAICFQHCKIRSEEDMPLEQEIGDVEGIHKLKEVISDLQYRNAMDVESILNYPSENESLMESPTNEEIIQGVMDLSANDKQDQDGSSLLPHVSPKENYLIQHEKNIPYLVYAFLKVKDEIEFDLHTKKKQLTIDAYFSKE
ncbi:hypothetical protein CXB51_004968 [Gossypium anomalum]|uniref:HTH CENPB-type domain-containing protein n=1 Tax=Gossypium anomalum TaxID=47600 RepID=A0A8J6D9A9_9ROSI|nr:hypothetical protein CXB51_004968 [Gossypium anomalum]